MNFSLCGNQTKAVIHITIVNEEMVRVQWKMNPHLSVNVVLAAFIV